MIGFGIMGYFLEKGGFLHRRPRPRLILGPIAEIGFGQSLIISGGSPMIFFERPLCVLLWVITLLLMIPAFSGHFRRSSQKEGRT